MIFIQSFFCLIIAQGSLFQVKIKTEEQLKELVGKNKDTFLRLKVDNHDLVLKPSYPQAKTPELRLLYDVIEGSENRKPK